MQTLFVSQRVRREIATLGARLESRSGREAPQGDGVATQTRTAEPIAARSFVDPPVYRLARGVHLTDDGVQPTVELPTGERLGMGTLAAGLLRMCEASTPITDLVEAAVFAFDIDHPVAFKHLDEFCRALLAAGVLEVVDVSSATARGQGSAAPSVRSSLS